MQRFAFAAVLLAITASPILSADWPRFRGPDGSGISTEKELPVTWNSKEHITWKTELSGPGASSPVFFGNKIFITSWTGFAVPENPNGSEADLRFHLICLDRKTGKIQWDKSITGKGAVQKPTRGGEGFASSTPMVDADRVYCFFGTSGLFAFDHSGKQLWQADVGNRKGDWISAASPILFGDLVIINASIESDSIVAVSQKDGKEKWRAKNIKQAWNTPILVKTKAGKVELVVATQPKIIGIDPTNGETLWTSNTDITWYIVPSLVANDETVFALGGRSGVMGLAVRTGGTGDVTKTHRLWTIKKGSNVSSPVFHQGHLYWMNDSNGTAYCAKAVTGEIVYEERVPRADSVYASALLAEGRIYYVGREGKTYVVAAKPKFELLATNDLNDRSGVDSTPVAIDGRLFIRSHKALYCIEK